MLRAFAYVTLHTFKNRIATRLRRLREPRYLISAVAGLAYLYFTIFRNAYRKPAPSSGGGELMLDFAAAIVLVVMVVAWALPGASGGLEFSEAEIQFLFPAPVTRRQLLTYKLMRGLPQLLITATLMTFFARRGNFVGLLLCFATLNVYFVMVRLARARLKLAGIGFIARLAGVVVVLALLSWLFSVEVSRAKVNGQLQQIFASRRPVSTAARVVDSPFHSRSADAALFVPRLFSHAVFGRSVSDVATHGLGLLILAALFYLGASRLNVSFEEASVTMSSERAARRARVRGQRVGSHVAFPRVPPPFRLRESFPPEAAIFWKNVVAALRISIAWAVVIIVLFLWLFLQATFTSEPVLRLTLATIACFFAALFPLLGTALFPQDLRLDLPRMEVLKSYPISGERLIAAELAAPLAIVAAIELFLLGGTSMVLQLIDKAPGTLGFFRKPEVVVTALLFAIPICATQLLIRNAVPVFLPAWAMRSKDEPRGFVQMGQRIVLMVGNLLVLGVALIPAALLFIPGLLIASRFFSGSPLVLALATVPAVALLFGEVWLGIRLLGAQFDRIDVTNDLDPAT